MTGYVSVMHTMSRQNNTTIQVMQSNQNSAVGAVDSSDVGCLRNPPMIPSSLQGQGSSAAPPSVSIYPTIPHVIFPNQF